MDPACPLSVSTSRTELSGAPSHVPKVPVHGTGWEERVRQETRIEWISLPVDIHSESNDCGRSRCRPWVESYGGSCQALQTSTCSPLVRTLRRGRDGSRLA